MVLYVGSTSSGLGAVVVVAGVDPSAVDCCGVCGLDSIAYSVSALYSSAMDESVFTWL